MPANKRPSGLSASTQDLLTKMMKDSGITPSQQRRLTASLAQGAPLPHRCHPTSSDPGKPSAMAAPSSSKTNRLVAPSGRVNPRLYTGGKRAKKDIQAVERPKFSGGVIVDRERVKAHYADTLTYGADGAARREHLREQARRGTLKARPTNRRPPGQGSDDEDGEDSHGKPAVSYRRDQREFDTVMSEINERKQHLDVMRRMGANTHSVESRLQRELALRVRRLEEIDRQQKDRVRELEQLGSNEAGTAASAVST
eukprot:m.82520 g.82520  ORF g.82520 m.82520 type:complete len:255 (+) comp9473_c0_seq2:230-994(+)